jgi:hypothetical protein
MVSASVVDRFLAAALLLALAVATPWAALAGQSLCGGTSIPLDTSVSGKPFVQLTLGDINGNFLLDTGATGSQVDRGRYGVPEGSRNSLSGFSLPTVQGGVFVAADLHSFAAPPGGELGTVGTDFLSLRPLEFHYEQAPPFAALGGVACDSAALQRAGFAEVGLPGYYAADLSRLKRGMPNVPVIGLRIGQVTFPAQVDTGLGDIPSGMIQVNAALMTALHAAEVPMHLIPSGIVTVGCSGNHTYERWQIERDEISVVTPDGQRIASYPPPLLEVKTDTGCGGISTFSAPFGQIGASWLSRWRASVFDGLSSEIWIPASP